MYIWFLISVLGVIAIIPLYFLSLEHIKLEKKYGKEKGKRIGATYGVISGWTFFLFWFGTWISPQLRFTIPLLQDWLSVTIFDFEIPIFHLMLSLPFIIAAFWFGIAGVRSVTLKTAETHRAEKIADEGIYSVVRHPQYLGGLFGHIGITILISALYSLIFLPFMIVIIYFISWKEEKELIKEFGEKYENYKKKVPMFIPRLRKKRDAPYKENGKNY